MKVFIQSEGQNTKVILNIKGLIANQQRGIRQAFYYIGKDLVKDNRRSLLSNDKRGRIYRLRRNGRTILHQASAPGQSPANFTGALKSSLDFNVVGATRLQFGSRETFLSKGGVPVNLKTRKSVKYGRFLELGTSKMEARPFLLPTIKENFRNMRRHFERELEKAMKNVK